MTFRKITFLFIAILLSLLLLLQFWLINNFTKDVSTKIGQAAFEVSRSTIETLVFKKPQVQFQRFAFNGRITQTEQTEILTSLATMSDKINISLQDGQRDNHLTIRSAGTSYQIDIPRTGIEKSLDDMSNKILLSAFAFIFIGLIAAGYFSSKISRPLKSLQQATNKVGLGDFGFQVNTDERFQSNELADTIKAFNEMSLKIDRLQKENEKLQKQTQLSELSEIARGLAHTIRNPLNTLNLVTDQMISTDDKKSKEKLSRIVKHQVHRIDKWVRSLMDIMSSDSNLTESIDLTELLESTIKDISLSNDSNSSLHFIVIPHADGKESDFNLNIIKPEIKGLLQGLIGNAIEASSQIDDEGYCNHIEIKLSASGESSRIEISDQGVGFSKEVKAKLFSPHNTNKTYGAGMGLYLAHRIASVKYNGNLQVTDNSSRIDQRYSGAKITLTLNSRL
ncbi:MAG: HAMP domain-containing histidine kinase [Kangiellaceae bacterium]|nr:HAMP domain-containing histidine kinase [Kangiellaceae bacterium]